MPLEVSVPRFTESDYQAYLAKQGVKTARSKPKPRLKRKALLPKDWAKGWDCAKNHSWRNTNERIYCGLCGIDLPFASWPLPAQERYLEHFGKPTA